MLQDWSGLTGVPDLADVRAWTGVSVSDMSDDVLATVLGAEIELQTEFCGIPDGSTVLPYNLAVALMRRCNRSVNARGAALGTLPAAMTGVPDGYGTGIANGPALLPQLDPEVERLEAPFRVIAMA